ncbi:hypothetical protein MCOR04_009437 [Pyricularia oryzae]|nr:hypothetical protein MCOR04_009437 [Pyricularia oryzae]
MDVIATFLKGVRELVVAGDGSTLCDWLVAEPDSPPAYHLIGQELRKKYPKGSSGLQALVEKSLPEEDNVAEGGSTPWPGFHAFMTEYLSYWRDVNFNDLMDIHERFCALSVSCTSALKHPGQGSIMVQTSVSYAQSMIKLVSVLNGRPDITAARRQQSSGDEGEARTFMDDSLDVIKEMFSSCARDRGQLTPGSKKSVVYLLASMAFRLLFICGRPMMAWSLLNGLEQAPPLSLYPAVQRTTYLYYLGLVMFQSDHYPRAAAALDEAYRQLPKHLTKQRRLVLTFLIPANILSGRLPSDTLLQRPEAEQLAPIFRPMAMAIRKGNFAAFQQGLNTHQAWLLERNLLFPLMYRARPLLWRSLTRRVFLLTYKPVGAGNEAMLPAGRKAVTLDLNMVHAAADYIQRSLEGHVTAISPRPDTKPSGHTTNPLLLRAVANSTPQPPESTTLVSGTDGTRKLRAYEGLLWGNLPVTVEHVEVAVMGLVAQGLMNGFISHSGRKFAIQNIKKTGGNAAAAGWPPNVSDVIVQRLRDQSVDTDWVPGWVR